MRLPCNTQQVGLAFWVECGYCIAYHLLAWVRQAALAATRPPPCRAVQTPEPYDEEGQRMGHVEPPGLDHRRFYCAACRRETDHEHFDVQGVRGQSTRPLPAEWAAAVCETCDAVTLFFSGEQVIPPRLYGQFDVDGLPRAIGEEIRFALKTVHSSPRASAAHARTALYAMLTDVAGPDDDGTPPSADELFARLVPEEHSVMHAYFRDTCLRSGVAVPDGMQQSIEPHGTASALLDLLRLMRDLYYPHD
jgi:hypothetical protein